MKTIFLVGYIGCGKSSLGRSLAQALGCQFVDLDDYIEQQEQTTIASLFSLRGEEAFRLLERAALEKLAMAQDTVVATGGGAACYADNIDLMNRQGISIYLRVSAQELQHRLSVPKHQAKRPLISQLPADELLSHIQTMLQQREPYYLKSQYIVDCTAAPKAENLQNILNTLLVAK